MKMKKEISLWLQLIVVEAILFIQEKKNQFWSCAQKNPSEILPLLSHHTSGKVEQVRLFSFYFYQKLTKLTKLKSVSDAHKHK